MESDVCMGSGAPLFWFWRCALHQRSSVGAVVSWVPEGVRRAWGMQNGLPSQDRLCGQP